MAICSDFSRNVKAQFEDIRKTAYAHEVKEKCWALVKGQKTGLDVIKAGKVFYEVFKDEKDPQFIVKFNRTATKLPVYYKEALIKDCGTFEDCAENAAGTEYALTILGHEEFISFLNTLYKEARSGEVKIDKIRLIEIANYLRADSFLEELFDLIQSSVFKISFCEALILSKRICNSPIRFHFQAIKTITILGECFGKHIKSAGSIESCLTLVEKCAEGEIKSLNFDANVQINVPVMRFINSIKFTVELNKVSSLTHLSLPKFAEIPAKHTFSTNIVSLNINAENMQNLSPIPSQLTSLKIYEAGQSLHVLNLPKLDRLKLIKGSSCKFDAFTALRKLSFIGRANTELYNIPTHVISLSFKDTYFPLDALQKLHSYVEKLKFTSFRGEMGDTTKHLGTRLKELTLDGRITDETILNLPRGLTRLVIMNNQTTNEAYKNLPPLLHLQLDLGKQTSKITKEVTEYLPRTLTYVYFKNGVVPKEMLQTLPKDCKVEML